MSDQDAARQQAQREVNQHQGPATTTTWGADAATAYNAERERALKERDKK